MSSTRRYTAAAAGLTALAAIVLAAGSAQADPPPGHTSQVAAGLALEADPGEVTIAPLPCDRRGEIDLGMANTSSEGRFVDALLTSSAGLQLSRGIWSTYLPAADPDQQVTAPVRVTAEEGTGPGEYQVSVGAADQELQIPVTVEDPPGDGPADNLALYQQASASTIHPNTTLCGGVDGNLDSEQWADSGIHDRTPGEFPDSFGVQLDDSYPISRVEVYTLDSATYPAAEMGIRDFEVQAHTAQGWHTLASVIDNEEGQVTLRFPSTPADEVRVIVHDSNDHKYSRIIELEIYQR